MILDVEPLFGPRSGGTSVDIVGIHLNATDQPVVYLGDSICPIANK